MGGTETDFGGTHFVQEFAVRMRAPAITGAILFCSVHAVAGQTVRGRLLELRSERPIPAGNVVLLSENGDPVAAARSDTNGVFILNAPTPGRYLIQATRLGYRRWVDGPVALAPADTVEVEFHLAELVLALDPLTITAEEAGTRYLQRVGFFERQKASFGHFITQDKIESRHATHITQLLSAIPGVTIMPVGSSLGRVRVQMRGSHLSDGGACLPRVYIDNLMVIRGEARSGSRLDPDGGILDDPTLSPEEGPDPYLDDMVDPMHVQAIEVYRSGLQVPAEYGGGFQECGVIVVWTNNGTERRR